MERTWLEEYLMGPISEETLGFLGDMERELEGLQDELLGLQEIQDSEHASYADVRDAHFREQDLLRRMGQLTCSIMLLRTQRGLRVFAEVPEDRRAK